MLKFLTAGESHGKCLVGILEGLPAGLKIKSEALDKELTRRRQGYGRSARMELEKDKVEILSGLRKEISIGSPIALLIKNRDSKIDVLNSVECARPGHADLAGALKYNTTDIRNILERASARETAMRVALGAVCKIFLQEFKIEIISHVTRIGGVRVQSDSLSFKQLCEQVSRSNLNCADETVQEQMLAEIDQARKMGDSLGGVFEVIAVNLPVGLGSYVHWEKRLDARIAASLMSIPAVKAVEIGAGFMQASQRGSQVHDALFYARGKGFFRKSNRAGGLEGGITNGEPLVLRCAMKPIATLKTPLPSVNIKTKRKTSADVQRADVCAVPAAGIVGEAALAFVLAQAILEKFGGDSLDETRRNYQGYLKQVKRF